MLVFSINVGRIIECVLVVQYYTGVVKLYAESFFDYAVSEDILEKLFKEVSKFEAVLKEDVSIIKIMAAPIYSDKQKEGLIQVIAKTLKLPKEIVNLLSSLISNSRIPLLFDVFDLFKKMVVESSGKKFVELTIYRKIDMDQQKELKKSLENSLGCEVELFFKVDPKILGGVIIKLDGKMIDDSLATKFHHLKNIVERRIALL